MSPREGDARADRFMRVLAVLRLYPNLQQTARSIVLTCLAAELAGRTVSAGGLATATGVSEKTLRTRGGFPYLKDLVAREWLRIDDEGYYGLGAHFDR